MGWKVFLTRIFEGSFVLIMAVLFINGFLAVQDSSIGDVVSQSVSESSLDFGDFRAPHYTTLH